MSSSKPKPWKWSAMERAKKVNYAVMQHYAICNSKINAQSTPVDHPSRIIHLILFHQTVHLCLTPCRICYPFLLQVITAPASGFPGVSDSALPKGWTCPRRDQQGHMLTGINKRGKRTKQH